MVRSGFEAKPAWRSLGSNAMHNLDVKQFAQYGVATVYEATGHSGLIDVPLIQIVPGSRVAGPARTVRCGQADNLMVHAVLDQVQPGEVLVLTMPEPEHLDALDTCARSHQNQNRHHQRTRRHRRGNHRTR